MSTEEERDSIQFNSLYEGDLECGVTTKLICWTLNYIPYSLTESSSLLTIPFLLQISGRITNSK